MMTRDEMLSLRLTALIILSAAGNGDEDPTTPRDGAPPADVTAPAAVTDLWVESVVGAVVTLTWTAPGDYANTGTASAYAI